MFLYSTFCWLVINISVTVVVNLAFIWLQPILQNAYFNDRNTNVTYANEEFVSSVWCRGETRATRLCRFKNLCYNSLLDEYLFFHGPATILNGLPRRASNSSAYFVADLSSVEELNTHYFTFTDMLSSKFANLKVTIVKEPTLLFKRFKPDNLMHVIHDDILPLFATLQEFCGGLNKDCVRQFQIANFDKLEPQFLQLYRLLSTRLMYTKDLQDDVMYCFQTAFVGVNKGTTWYKYGYDKPQGPIKRPASGSAIRTAVLSMLEDVGVQQDTCNVSDRYIVLLSRKSTRRILNEAEIIQVIIAETSLKVIILDNVDQKINDSIKTIACAEMLIGMHGAALVLSMFMRSKSVLLELFPYGVSPVNYSPYKTLAQIPQLDLVYGAWENINENDTLVHPDWPPELGGLTHLSPEDQKVIMESKTVPKHLCCDNPHWLFRIYQDTFVNPIAFQQLVRKLYNDSIASKHSRKTFSDNYFYPGPVRNMNCATVESNMGHYYLITWDIPWNVQLTTVTNIKYQIWIEAIGINSFSSSETNNTWYKIPVMDRYSKYNIWATCTINDKSGNRQWTICQ